MNKVVQFSSILFWSVVAVSIVAGFVHWILFLPVAFTGAFVFDTSGKVRRPAVLAALATAFGWLLTAFIRDVVEGGRVSARLASFLSLSHAVMTYIVLFLICFIPAFFAACSGTRMHQWLRTGR